LGLGRLRKVKVLEGNGSIVEESVTTDSESRKSSRSELAKLSAVADVCGGVGGWESGSLDADGVGSQGDACFRLLAAR
jgi:hypothetical protein